MFEYTLYNNMTNEQMVVFGRTLEDAFINGGYGTAEDLKNWAIALIEYID